MKFQPSLFSPEADGGLVSLVSAQQAMPDIPRHLGTKITGVSNSWARAGPYQKILLPEDRRSCPCDGDGRHFENPTDGFLDLRTLLLQDRQLGLLRLGDEFR